MNCGGTTIDSPSMTTTNAPAARALSISALSAGDSPWLAGATRSLKMRGELTIAARSGFRTGTLITSIRKSEELGSLSGVAPMHPGSSLGERMPADPEI